MQPTYDVDFFIKKFEAIPEDMWAISSRFREGKRCAYGWCYPSGYEAYESMVGGCRTSDEEKSLTALIRILNPEWGAATINNGIAKEYPQPTPKQRILAALYDIKKMQQPVPEPKKEQTIVKERIVYVPVYVSESIKEQVTDLIMQ